MKATILDTQTGQTHIIDGPSCFEFAENNWSCDCNRNPQGCGDVCESNRFLVVAFEPTLTGDEDWTLAQLNQDYPAELLAAHGIHSASGTTS